jgi:imidazolonepropionase-like amidohydrolase
VLPGGDYGFAFNPHYQNARDLELFVKHLGFTPMEAIRSCTLYGGQVMRMPHDIGQLQEGFLADLLLVDGDPLADVRILRDPKRILAVMKDGVFAKAPPLNARSWERAA